jgi:hypothetical protein
LWKIIFTKQSVGVNMSDMLTRGGYEAEGEPVTLKEIDRDIESIGKSLGFELDQESAANGMKGLVRTLLMIDEIGGVITMPEGRELSIKDIAKATLSASKK